MFHLLRRIIKYPLFILLILGLMAEPCHAQDHNSDFNQARFNTVVITEAIVATAGTIALHYLWYKKFPKSRFHFFNDNAEWMYIDKIGHATTAYNFSAIQYDLMRWSGVGNTQAAWIGGLTALGLQTMIEVFDVFSQQWGFSKGDMLANIVGSAMFCRPATGWGNKRRG
jgi:hypothetical protein